MDTQTHHHCTLYIHRFMYRYTVLLYTNCTYYGLYTSVYACAQYWTTFHYHTHLWCTHYAWISWTALHLFCSPVTVHLYFRTCKFVLTNERPRKITLMNRVDQSQLIFLGVPDYPPNCCMLTQPFCPAERAV